MVAVSAQYRNTYATTDTQRAKIKNATCVDCGKPKLFPKRVRCDACYIENKNRKQTERARAKAKLILEQEARVIGDALGINFTVRRLSLIRAVLAARAFRNSNKPRLKPVEPE